MFKKIAENIIKCSLELKPGEKLNILIQGKSQNILGREIERIANENGIQTRYGFDNLDYYETFTDEEFEKFVERELKIMQLCDACVRVVDMVPVQLSDKAVARRNYFLKVVRDDVMLKKRWNLTSVPCRDNFKSEDEYRELLETYIKSCSIDYNKMSKAMDKLVTRLSEADIVRIVAKGTDLTFSIKGMPAIKCFGKLNLPDGEIFTAPRKDSVNGYITYNLPSSQNGVTHNNIYFEFRDGKIVREYSDNTEELTKVLNTDEGARYIGEFSFGVNPYVKKCFNNTLYDEKIRGSIHLTPGDAYEECDNGNRSIVHWDLVQSHNLEHGGGEIWLDDELIRKDGIFVVDYLKCLNPVNLINKFNNEVVKKDDKEEMNNY